MFTPENTPRELNALENALEAIPKREAIAKNVSITRPEVILTPRQAAFSQKITLPVEECAGKILASACVSCPPAVPIVMCGERIGAALIPVLKESGTERLVVVGE